MFDVDADGGHVIEPAATWARSDEATALGAVGGRSNAGRSGTASAASTSLEPDTGDTADLGGLADRRRREGSTGGIDAAGVHTIR